MDGLVHQQIVIRTLSDNSEVVDEGKLEGPVDDWNRILLLSHTCGVVCVTSGEPYARGALRLGVGFDIGPVAVDCNVVLEVERALNQHKLSGPAISTWNESDQCKRDEVVSGYGERLC